MQSLKAILSDEGYQVLVAGSGEEAVKIVEEEMPQLVLLDVWLPGMDGLDTLKAIKKINPQSLVIIMSGHGTIETAVKATKLGAFDFIEKPLSLDKIIILVNNALSIVRLQEENVLLKQKVTHHQYELTGSSPAITELKEMISIVAPTNAWILIMGENGTGKELVARSIHHLSLRAHKVLSRSTARRSRRNSSKANCSVTKRGLLRERRRENAANLIWPMRALFFLMKWRT